MHVRMHTHTRTHAYARAHTHAQEAWLFSSLEENNFFEKVILMYMNKSKDSPLLQVGVFMVCGSQDL